MNISRGMLLISLIIFFDQTHTIHTHKHTHTYNIQVTLNHMFRLLQIKLNRRKIVAVAVAPRIEPNQNRLHELLLLDFLGLKPWAISQWYTMFCRLKHSTAGKGRNSVNPIYINKTPAAKHNNNLLLDSDSRFGTTMNGSHIFSEHNWTFIFGNSFTYAKNKT